MTSPTKRALLATAAALALFGCGVLPGSTTVNEITAVEEVPYQQFAAYQTGDMETAFSKLRVACQRWLGLSDFTATMKRRIAEIEEFVGSKLSDMRMRDVSVLSFTTGQVTLSVAVYLDDGTRVSDPAAERQEMIFEDGRWRVRDCLFGL